MCYKIYFKIITVEYLVDKLYLFLKTPLGKTSSGGYSGDLNHVFNLINIENLLSYDTDIGWLVLYLVVP